MAQVRPFVKSFCRKREKQAAKRLIFNKIAGKKLPSFGIFVKKQIDRGTNKFYNNNTSEFHPES